MGNNVKIVLLSKVAYPISGISCVTIHLLVFLAVLPKISNNKDEYRQEMMPLIVKILLPKSNEI